MHDSVDTTDSIEDSDLAPSEKIELAKRSSRAWDTLYSVTDDPVWGNVPPPFLADHLQRLQPYLGPDARILDLAAGEGRCTHLLLKTGAVVLSCDASMSGLRKFPKHCSGSVHRICGNIKALPIAGGSITAALLIDVIETLPDAPAILREVYRVLAPGGHLLCNIPGPDDGIASVEMEPQGDGGFLYKSSYYYRFYTEAEAHRLVEESGFSIEFEERRLWWETAHPHFRTGKHLHISRVFLLRKR